MKSKLYIDKGASFISAFPETLSDGSQVWGLHFRSGEVIPCLSEARADRAISMIAIAIKEATGQDPLVL